MRNKIEGVNRARTEAMETVHHLFIAHLKKYIEEASYLVYRDRYHECVRMLNGLERSLERKLPRSERRLPTSETESESLVPDPQS